LSSGFVLQEEIANLALFLASVPGNLVASILDGPSKQQGKSKKSPPFGRANTYFTHNVIHALPIYADWSGTSTPVLPFVGRMGQITFVDLWDTDQSKNALIVAPTGAGKSFLSNHIAAHYWSINALVRILDVGRSYKPICDLLGGQFIEIDPANPITINPFSEVKDLHAEMDFLVAIVAKMFKPKDPISDREKGILERAITMTFEKYGNDTDITKIRNTLLRMHEVEQDKLFKDMAVDHLAPWAEGGQYAKLVNGKNQVNFNNPFVVVEMGMAEAHESLKSVALLIAFYHISRDVYTGDTNTKKVIIWDEAWRYFDDELAVAQIERAVREYRKFNAAAIIITQSVSDFERNKSTKIIDENTHFKFLLKQDPGAIVKMEKQEKFGLPPFAFKIMRTVRIEKGKFSEAFILTNRDGAWVTRFLVPPPIYWIYTTDPDDKTLREIFLEAGLSVSEMMDKCMEISSIPELRDFWYEVARRKQLGEEIDIKKCFEKEKEIRKWIQERRIQEKEK
jgi:conjugal transfer ATP-binding protein TraC